MSLPELCNCNNSLPRQYYRAGRLHCFYCDKLSAGQQPLAGPSGSVSSSDVALAEVKNLAERVTVLEGMVGELRRTVAELLRAPATAAPAEQKKRYWR